MSAVLLLLLLLPHTNDFLTLQYVYESVISPDLECPICLSPLEEPLTLNCGQEHSVCRKCHKQIPAKCPRCNLPINKSKSCHAVALKRMAGALLVRCPICEATPRRDELSDHIKVTHTTPSLSPSNSLSSSSSVPPIPDSMPHQDIVSACFACCLAIKRTSVDGRVEEDVASVSAREFLSRVPFSNISACAETLSAYEGQQHLVALIMPAHYRTPPGKKENHYVICFRESTTAEDWMYNFTLLGNLSLQGKLHAGSISRLSETSAFNSCIYE